MSVVFADTFYFIALMNPGDHAHPQAAEYAGLVDRLVTTEWVLLELADGLADTENRHVFSIIRTGLSVNPLSDVVPPQPRTPPARHRPLRPADRQDVVADRLSVVRRDGRSRANGSPHGRPALRAGGVRRTVEISAPIVSHAPEA